VNKSRRLAGALENGFLLTTTFTGTALSDRRERMTGMEMRAIVLDGPGEPEDLRVRRVPVPDPEPGWVRIKVEAFGVNRSEYHLRAGLATNARFPDNLGIRTGLPHSRGPACVLLS